MQELPLQTRLIERIQDLIPSNLAIVDVLCDLLEISADSVYRRLRNQTSLSIEEVAKICNHFNISFDDLNTIENASSISFSFSPLKTVNDYKTYLQSIHDDLTKVVASGNGKILWVAKDIPIFYHFKSPFLAAFMIYYWFHCIIDTEEHRDKKFNLSLIDDDILQLTEDIYHLYTRIPSVEIWTNLTIVPLLVQMDYIWQSGLFESKEDALKLCSLIEEQVNSIQKQANLSLKLGLNDRPDPGEGNYQLYHSDIEIGNNTILVKTGESKIVYLIHNTLNKIVTINREFCDTTEDWIDNLMKKSSLISGVSEKQRYQFFNGMKAQISELEKKISEGG